MALQSVFANDLHFGKKNVDCNQSQDDEREDADLEEGEIAEDDDEVQQQESKPTPKISEKESEKKDGKSTHTGSEKVESHGSSSKSSGSSKRREKRNPSNSRARKRVVAENLSDHRDLNRKRRRVQDGDDDAEEGDYDMMNARGHSPLVRQPPTYGGGGDSPGSDYEANLLASMQRRQRGEGRARRASPPRRRGARGSSRDRGGGGDRRRSDRDHERDRRPVKTNASSLTVKVKDESICAFYMEGKCSRGNDCPFSHAALPPRKMELCKFYLMDCCAKKEKCLYLHKDFPCKFFHTGRKCRSTAEDCKFSHESLSDTMRAILIKHIETAPREILGDFPRMTRDETIQAIDKFANPNPNNEREKRPVIPSLFESVSISTKEAFANADSERHQTEPYLDRNDDNGSSSDRRVVFYQETQATVPDKDQDREEENSRSIWFGQLRQETKAEERNIMRGPSEHDQDFRSEQQHPHSPPTTTARENHTDYFSALPARQRQLFRRIQQQQREPVSVQDGGNLGTEENPSDEKWHVYSSDEEENGKSISDIFKNIPHKPEMRMEKDACSQLPNNLNLSSLENINVAEIAKALSTLQQGQTSSHNTDDVSSETEMSTRRDPRKRDPRMRNVSTAQISSTGDVDLRLSTVQGGILSMQPQDVDLRLISQNNADVDLRSLVPLGNLDDVGSSDIDLRRLGLPFKPTQHNIPIREFHASYSSHDPIEYHVSVVDFIPLDYSLVRVDSDWAHLDPRQKGRDLNEVRDFTNTDTPSIPLGPASPDPPATQSAPVRRYETDNVRLAPNDPRARRTPSQQQPNQSQEKRGLLGVAPPGMLPFFSRTGDTDSRTGDSTYSNYTSSYAERDFDIGRVVEQQIRTTENRRDPRQRLRNSATSQNR